MNKPELASRLAARFPQLTAQDAKRVVSTLLNAIADSLIRGQHIEIRGFGCFDLHYRPERNARNPKSGEHITASARYLPRFKPAKEMRERVDAHQEAIVCEDTTDEAVQPELRIQVEAAVS